MRAPSDVAVYCFFSLVVPSADGESLQDRWYFDMFLTLIQFLPLLIVFFMRKQVAEEVDDAASAASDLLGQNNILPRIVGGLRETAASSWVKMKDKMGAIYYYHKETRASQWERPEGVVVESDTIEVGEGVVGADRGLEMRGLDRESVGFGGPAGGDVMFKSGL